MSELSWHQQRAMGMHACPDDIVGYTYQADNYCPDCIGSPVAKRHLTEVQDSAAALRLTGRVQDTERWLDWVAARAGIDRQDESSFDSEEFPKVLFRALLTEQDGDREWSHGERERCGRCHRVLGE